MSRLDRAMQLEDGPWTEMIDAISPTARKEGALRLLKNCYPLDPELGEGVVGRPGMWYVGQQMGSAGRRRVQGFHQYTKEDGSEFTVCVTGGYFYVLDWFTEVWVEVLTTADLTTAGITLDQAAHVAFVTFSDKLHVSDGVNPPWLWDGTTGGGLTALTASPVLYGQPTLCQGRVFGIKALNPGTMVWSEVDDATIGYDTYPYTNAWTLSQTDTNRLYSLVGDNDALYVLRARSATLATGFVSSTFSSESTKEGISSSEGTIAPFTVIFIGSAILFLDADLHPQWLRPGAGQLRPIWSPFRETLRHVTINPDVMAKCLSVHYTPASLALIAIPEVAQAECTQLLVYDVKNDTPRAVAIWNGWEMTALAMVKSAKIGSIGEPLLFHGDTLGYSYWHGNPEHFAPWDDIFIDNVARPIQHEVRCQPLAYSTKREKIYDRIDIAVRAQTMMTLGVSVDTPRGLSTPRQVVVDIVTPAGLSLWDAGVWDVTDWDTTPPPIGVEGHADIGIDEQARWIAPRITHAGVGEQFGLIALTVLGYGHDDDPEVP